jgi:4'-phosphopantetheinyl transferase
MLARLSSWLPGNFDFESLGNEVHIWCLSVKSCIDDISNLAETLSEDELVRAARFHSDRHKNNYIISHGSLRVLIGHYLNIEPQDLRFRHERSGKPSLDPHYHADSDLKFNLSHSQDLSLFAFTFGCEIGIDCEHIRQLPDADAIVERFFSKQEIEYFTALPEDKKELAFFASWTRKEAYIKALGSGLSMPLNSFTISMGPDEPARLLHVAGGSNEPAKWKLKSWEPASGYIAAVAIKSVDLNLRFLQLPYEKGGSKDGKNNAVQTSALSV